VCIHIHPVPEQALCLVTKDVSAGKVSAELLVRGLSAEWGSGGGRETMLEEGPAQRCRRAAEERYRRG